MPFWHILILYYPTRCRLLLPLLPLPRRLLIIIRNQQLFPELLACPSGTPRSHSPKPLPGLTARLLGAPQTPLQARRRLLRRTTSLCLLLPWLCTPPQCSLQRWVVRRRTCPRLPTHLLPRRLLMRPSIYSTANPCQGCLPHHSTCPAPQTRPVLHYEHLQGVCGVRLTGTGNRDS